MLKKIKNEKKKWKQAQKNIFNNMKEAISNLFRLTFIPAFHIQLVDHYSPVIQFQLFLIKLLIHHLTFISTLYGIIIRTSYHAFRYMGAWVLHIMLASFWV